MTKVSSVGIVSMGEAGNLGDDLILCSLVDKLQSVLDPNEITFLSHGIPLEWDAISARLDWSVKPRGVGFSREIPGGLSHSKLFADNDLVMFGGGGLLQNLHSVNEPMHWMGFLPRGDSRPRIVAIGLGLGPFNPRWVQTLRDLGSPFDLCYVRDEDSFALATRDLAWKNVRLSADLVDEPFLSEVVRTAPAEEAPNGGGTPVLGVALREWPAIDSNAIVSEIDRMAEDHRAEEVRFFVLESKPWDRRDTLYTEQVAAELKTTAEVRIEEYQGGDCLGFLDRMSGVTAAVSMKLHSSEIWNHFNIPQSPIIYAPKIASFFGLPYSGPEVVGGVTPPNHASRHDAPSPKTALAGLGHDMEHLLSGVGALGFRQRFVLGVERYSGSVAVRIRKG